MKRMVIMINHIVYFGCRPVSKGDAMLILDLDGAGMDAAGKTGDGEEIGRNKTE